MKKTKKKWSDNLKQYLKNKIPLYALVCALLLVMLMPATAFAAKDPLSVISNLSTFMFAVIKGIGVIILGFGIVQIGLSLKSHDASQRANGFLTLAGGVIIMFAQEILTLIAG